MSFADVEQAITARLNAAGFRASTELSPGFDTRLPVVEVQALPGTVRARPFNGGSLVASVDVDVDVYAADLESVFDLGQSVTDELDGWSDGPISVSVSSTFARRPDFNPSVRRRGAVFTALIRRI